MAGHAGGGVQVQGALPEPLEQGRGLQGAGGGAIPAQVRHQLGSQLEDGAPHGELDLAGQSAPVDLRPDPGHALGGGVHHGRGADHPRPGLFGLIHELGRRDIHAQVAHAPAGGPEEGHDHVPAERMEIILGVAQEHRPLGGEDRAAIGAGFTQQPGQDIFRDLRGHVAGGEGDAAMALGPERPEGLQGGGQQLRDHLAEGTADGPGVDHGRRAGTVGPLDGVEQFLAVVPIHDASTPRAGTRAQASAT